MKKLIWTLAILCIGILSLTGCAKKKPDIEYIESSCDNCKIEKNKIELQYSITLVNNTNETKYFYLYLDTKKEDDNLVKEEVIPAYEKDTGKKQVFMLAPKEGANDYFDVFFRGTHGTQGLKEDKDPINKENLIINEIPKGHLPNNANIYSLTKE